MSTFAQTSAATTAATRTPELPDSVRRNERSGAVREPVQGPYTGIHLMRSYTYRMVLDKLDNKLEVFIRP